MSASIARDVISLAQRAPGPATLAIPVVLEQPNEGSRVIDVPRPEQNAHMLDLLFLSKIIPHAEGGLNE